MNRLKTISAVIVTTVLMGVLTGCPHNHHYDDHHPPPPSHDHDHDHDHNNH